MIARRPPLTTLKIAATLLLVVTGVTLLGLVAQTARAQTVPTMTPSPPPGTTVSPTPGSGGATATSGPPPATASPGTTGTPAATNTRPPVGQATATPTRRAGTAQATPGASPTALLRGITLPTAEACSQEPTARVGAGGAWVADGPGEEYERLGRLAAGTVRPIVGRASDVEWWLIDLDDHGEGWIADAEVTVRGDTSSIPVVSAPPLPDGATPTPGSPWRPTPAAACLTPTPTATTEADTPTPVPSPTTTATAEPPTPTPAPDEPVAETLPGEETTDRLFWLPVAAIVLIAAGAFLYATRRS
jgi:hypothetical protein